MIEKCPVCGKKYGGFLSAKPASPDLVNALQKIESFQEGICHSCATKVLKAKMQENDAKLASLQKSIESRISSLSSQVLVCTSDVPEKYVDNIKGMVTGYTICPSNNEEVINQKSTYSEKLRTSESYVVRQAQRAAVRMGGNMIFAGIFSMAAISASNKWLTFSFAGTAVYVPKNNDAMDELMLDIATVEKLKEKKQ